MPRFAANLSLLFTELPFLDRFDAARRAGFSGVEFLFPYDHAAADLRRALHDCGLPLILFNTPPGDFAAGERGFAAVPEAEARFREDFALAMDYAAHLAPLHIHVMSGNAEGADARDTLIRNLRRATGAAPTQSLLIEPLNPTDMPGYFLADFETAHDVIGAVADEMLGLQFDAYHALRMGLALNSAWQAARSVTRHVQIAAATGRTEPDLETFAAFFARLDRDGYAGWVSGEYKPRGRTEDGLDWLTYA